MGAVALLGAGCGDDGDPVAASDPTVASSEPATVSLVGTWTGDRERVKSDEYHQGSATLAVTEQNGLTFSGSFTWSTPSGEDSEAVVGAFTPGGELMSGVAVEGVFSFVLIEADTLDYCYLADGDDMRVACGRLQRQD